MDSNALVQLLKAAMQHQQAGRFPQAEAVLRDVLAAYPNHPIAVHHLGLIAHQTARRDEAIELLEASIATAPTQARFRTNYSAVLREMGRIDDAIDQLTRAVQLSPGDFELLKRLAGLLEFADKTDAAAGLWRDAIKRAPDDAGLNNLAAAALGRMAHLDEAAAILRHAIARDPSDATAHANLGLALADMGEIERAIDSLHRAIECRPDYMVAHQNLLFFINFHPKFDPPAIFAEHRRWAKKHADRYASSIVRHENDRDPDRVLRIGYVSPDFREHPVGRLIEPVLARHDRTRFHVTCYANVSCPDAVTRRTEKLADTWRPIVRESDERLAEIVRRDRIDILVDLSLHMAGNRLLTFARKPAPVQATWLGYPGTSGLQTIDYRITDEVMDPAGDEERAKCYSEKSVRLKSFWCYAPVDDSAAEVSELPATGNGFVTFASFNNLAKVNDLVLDAWADILNRVANSRMLLLHNGREAAGASSVASRRITKHLSGRGIDPARLEFVPRQPHADYMKLYRRADIALDPFPYPGHTTTLDAAWMGVPVVTTTGSTASSFGGASILSNLNLADLITSNRTEYASKAVELANDLPRLASLRPELARLKNSPIGDAAAFTKALEAEYRRMWRAGSASV